MEATKRPWKVSWVRWTQNAPVMGFAIRPADEKLLREKRGVSIAALNCAEPNISAEAMYPDGELEANAELIIRAVNRDAAFESLLVALRHILPRFDITADGECKFCGRDYSTDIPKDYFCNSEDCDGLIARAALAEGETK